MPSPWVTRMSLAMSEEKGGAAMSDTIDMRPTDDGFVATGKVFIDSILSDVPKRRKADVAAQLSSLLDIERYLGAQHGRNLTDATIRERAYTLVTFAGRRA